MAFLMQIFVYITAFLFPVIFAYRDAYCKPLDNTKFHTAGFIMRASCGLAMLQDLSIIVLYGAYFWIVFDLLYVYFRGWNIGHVGTTAYLDRTLGKYIYYYKAIAFIVGIVIYLLFNYLNL